MNLEIGLLQRDYEQDKSDLEDGINLAGIDLFNQLNQTSYTNVSECIEFVKNPLKRRHVELTMFPRIQSSTWKVFKSSKEIRFVPSNWIPPQEETMKAVKKLGELEI